MNDYRTRIYERYSSAFQDSDPVFDSDAAAAWGKAYRHYLRDWLPANRGAAILDVACGGGALLYFFKSRGYSNLSGVDVSPEQVALSRQVISSVAEEGVAEFLREHSTEFDLITGLDVVEHLQKGEVLEFLDGCFRALRPGGRLVLQTPNAETPWGTQLRYADFTHEVCFTPNSLGRLLRLCGFANVQAREQGPIPFGYSFGCSVRAIMWRGVRQLLRFYNTVETGSPGSGVFTRVFMVSGVKP